MRSSLAPLAGDLSMTEPAGRGAGSHAKVAARTKRCWVAYATQQHQYLWEVEVAEDASADAVIAAARALAGPVAVPWEQARIGIFGEPCLRTDVPRDKDRIELYRPLAQDPKAARRDRVRRSRKGVT
jgi:uncharacterized protein